MENNKINLIEKIISNAALACEQIRNHHISSKDELLSLCIIFMEMVGIKNSTTVEESIKLIKEKINEMEKK